MEIIDVHERTGFAKEFMPRILRAKPNYKVPLICMEPGQRIEPHASGLGIFYVVSGRGIITVEGREAEVKAGNMIIVEQGEVRGIRATTERLVAFAVHIM